MTENNAELILEVWQLFKEFVPVKSRLEVAEQFAILLENHDIYLEDLDDLKGEDKILDQVIKNKTSEEDADEDEDEGF